MINASELFSSKIAESTRQFSARLMYGTEEIRGAIRSVQIVSGACSEENFIVGALFSSYIEVVIDEHEGILEDKELLLQIGLLVDNDTVEYVDIGYYTVTKPKSSVYSTTFTAVGRITSKLNELFDVPEVLTLRNIANAITAATGVTIIFNGEVSEAVLTNDMTGMTCKEALSVIAGTFGGFATENNAGNIVVSKYNTDSRISVNGDRMTVLPEFNDLDYELYGVKVVVSAESEDEDGNAIEEIAFSEGTPRITITNEFMTADLFESFVANTVGYTFRPGVVPLALGDPRLEPWDCLEVTDVKGNIHIVSCLNIVHTFDGGLTTTITAPGESESESDSSVAGPITQQLERMNSLLITAQEAIIKRLKADDLEAEVAKLGYASVKELEAVNATIEDLNAKDAEITGKLTANDAAIESLQAKDTEITGLLSAANAEITNLKAKDAEIEGTLSAATADITDLKAKDVEIEGTLSAATADITDLKAKDAEIEGTLTATNAEITSLKAKDVEIDGQLTAVSASIDELKVKDAEIESLVAEKASVEDLEAVTADIEELVAKDAEIEALVAKKIDAETVEATYLKAADLKTEVADFGYAKVENLNTDYARLDQANINQAWVMDLLVTGNFLADDFNAATGSFSKYLTGVKILGDLIEANTLKANTLILQGEDGIYRRLNIDALGQAVVDSDPKYNQGIDGSVLVKESITADKINVTDLFAQNITATGSIRGLSIIGGTIMGTLGEIGAFKLSPSGLESRLSAEAIYDWSEMDFAEGTEITTPYDYTVGRFTDFYKVDSLTEITFSAEGVSLGDNIPTLAYAISGERYGKMEDISDYKIQFIEIRKILTDGGYVYNTRCHDITTEPQTITVPETCDQVAFGIGIYATGMCGKDTATSLSYASHYLLWGYDTLYSNYEYTVQALATTIKPRVVIKGTSADVSINPFGFKYGGFFVTNNGDVFLDDSELEALWAENVEV